MLTEADRIDAGMNLLFDVQREWCEPRQIFASVADLGCIDAPDTMPAGSCRKTVFHISRDYRDDVTSWMPSAWRRDYQRE
jgi:hypothetical protein